MLRYKSTILFGVLFGYYIFCFFFSPILSYFGVWRLSFDGLFLIFIFFPVLVSEVIHSIFILVVVTIKITTDIFHLIKFNVNLYSLPKQYKDYSIWTSFTTFLTHGIVAMNFSVIFLKLFLLNIVYIYLVLPTYLNIVLFPLYSYL